MATHQVSRPSAHSKRPLPAQARPSKSAALSKRANSHAPSKAGAKAAQRKEEEFEDDESMATSFLQYCTTCEKQIIVPKNSVLYCSESCRKKDNEKALPYAIERSPPLTPFSSSNFDDSHFRDIVPRRSPTAPPSKRSSMVLSEMSSEDTTASGDENPIRDSEASRYLRQFHSTTVATDLSVRHHRPPYNRSSTSQATSSAAPSLSHTPASSVSYSMPFTPSTRPLPPRTNPHISSYGSRSIDLVTPFTIANVTSSPPSYSLKSDPISTTSTGTAEGEILYEKKLPLPTSTPVNGSLKRLFASAPHWA
ncbi:hypothetical protein GQ43DRAFT_362749 [Delitschia confertaspora ATCC 74209]|uniref:Life-span regulatory factor-domain-containing protein n=1 Tax=Delitschia confertaspora ATCC 74209 TaxID=1513339 RepID=A0A9P4JUD8_9PLEO|nr:hypothetical protein GQ43DRAFT_362749 [Delitschia confertaspora ATCC 74209]